MIELSNEISEQNVAKSNLDCDWAVLVRQVVGQMHLDQQNLVAPDLGSLVGVEFGQLVAVGFLVFHRHLLDFHERCHLYSVFLFRNV